MPKNSQMRLRTLDDLVIAYERVHHGQVTGNIDVKAAQAMVATLNGSTYLIARLPFHMARLRVEAAKLVMSAHARKVKAPIALLPLEVRPRRGRPKQVA